MITFHLLLMSSNSADSFGNCRLMSSPRNMFYIRNENVQKRHISCICRVGWLYVCLRYRSNEENVIKKTPHTYKHTHTPPGTSTVAGRSAASPLFHRWVTELAPTCPPRARTPWRNATLSSSTASPDCPRALGWYLPFVCNGSHKLLQIYARISLTNILGLRWSRRAVIVMSVRPSVRLSRLFSNLNRARGAYSTLLTRGQHATLPAYIYVRVLQGRTYLFTHITSPIHRNCTTLAFTLSPLHTE